MLLGISEFVEPVNELRWEGDVDPDGRSVEVDGRETEASQLQEQGVSGGL